MKNVLLINVDSVNYETYKKCGYNGWLKDYEKEGYAAGDNKTSVNTVNFFLNTFRLKHELTNKYARNYPFCGRRNDLVSLYKKFGYHTIFASDWPYAPHNSRFCELCEVYFDEVLGEREVDFNRLKDDCLRSVKASGKPCLLIVQTHDTHLDFKTSLNPEWYDWIAEGERIMNTKDFWRINWNEALARPDFMELMIDARRLQCEAIKATLELCEELIEKTNSVFYVVGDHHVFLEDGERVCGPNFSIKYGDERLKTPWFSNHYVGYQKRLTISSLYDLIASNLRIKMV